MAAIDQLIALIQGQNQNPPVQQNNAPQIGPQLSDQNAGMTSQDLIRQMLQPQQQPPNLLDLLKINAPQPKAPKINLGLPNYDELDDESKAKMQAFIKQANIDNPPTPEPVRPVVDPENDYGMFGAVSKAQGARNRAAVGEFLKKFIARTSPEGMMSGKPELWTSPTNKIGPTPTSEEIDKLLAEAEGGGNAQEGDGTNEPSPTLPSNSEQYDKLLASVNSISDHITTADEAARQAKLDFFKNYDQYTPQEPITPLRILGDLISIGANFAVSRNPGLALAMSGAGKAIKAYDPTYSDWMRRKQFSNSLLEGLSAIDLKKFQTVAEEPAKIRELKQQIALAQIAEQGAEARSKFSEQKEDIRSRRASETALRQAGIKTGMQAEKDQIEGLVSDLPYIRKILEDQSGDESDMALPDRVHYAMRTLMKQNYPREVFEHSSVSKAEKILLKLLQKEMETSK